MGLIAFIQSLNIRTISGGGGGGGGGPISWGSEDIFFSDDSVTFGD